MSFNIQFTNFERNFDKFKLYNYKNNPNGKYKFFGSFVKKCGFNIQDNLYKLREKHSACNMLENHINRFPIVIKFKIAFSSSLKCISPALYSSFCTNSQYLLELSRVSCSLKANNATSLVVINLPAIMSSASLI